MRSRNLVAILCLLLGLLAPLVQAGTYRLNDGRVLSGDPISFNESGLIVREREGGVSARTSWDEFTQETLKQLLAEAGSEKEKAYIAPYITEIVEREAKRKEIVIQPAPKPELPKGKTGLSAGFSSPVFIVIFLILYAANIYAAFEIALFKYQLPLLVCGVSAVAPGLGPILFLCLPARADPNRDTTADAPVLEETPVAEGDVVDAARRSLTTISPALAFQSHTASAV